LLGEPGQRSRILRHVGSPITARLRGVGNFWTNVFTNAVARLSKRQRSVKRVGQHAPGLAGAPAAPVSVTYPVTQSSRFRRYYRTWRNEVTTGSALDPFCHKGLADSFAALFGELL
jgi:hypothetical protein